MPGFVIEQAQAARRTDPHIAVPVAMNVQDIVRGQVTALEIKYLKGLIRQIVYGDAGAAGTNPHISPIVLFKAPDKAI